MNPFAKLTLRMSACLLVVSGVLGFGLTSGQVWGQTSDVWYRLEFAGSKPPCADREPTDTSRCYGTKPETSLFEMRDGERIEMPGGNQLPEAWMMLNRIWTYAPAVAGEYLGRSIELTGTPMGARLIIEDGDRQYLQSVELNRWIRLGTGNQMKLWVRVTPAGG